MKKLQESIEVLGTPTPATVETVETVETVVTPEIVETVDVVPDEIIQIDDESMEEKYNRLIEESKVQELKIAELQKQAVKAEQLSFDMVLKNEGLESFSKLFVTTDRNEQLSILKGAIDEILIKNSYVPTDNSTENAYDVAIKSGNVENAIKNKFAKLFK